MTVAVVGLLAVLLALPAEAAFPGANGEIFASVTGEGIIAINPDGSTRVVDDMASANVEVTPDGRFLTLQNGDGGFDLISTVGGPRQNLIADAGVAKPEFAWSPDGSRFAVTELVEGEDGTLRTYAADGTDPQKIPVTRGASEFVWATDGLLYTTSGAVIDPATGSQTFIETQGYSISDFDRGIDASPDALMLVTSCFAGNQPPAGLCVTDTAFNLITFIPPPPNASQAEYGHFSPDGTRIVFDTLSSDDSGMWTVNVDGTDMRQLLGGVDVSEPPEWGRVPDTAPMPLEEPPPPPTNAALECGGFDGNPATTERADFADPVLYAVAVSNARFGCDTDSADARHVVLSRDDAFADSLVGAALTGEGPLLFTQTDTLPAETAAEIQRLLEDGDTVYLLGGTAAISQAIADQLTAFDVQRLAGPSRVETSVEVASEVARLYDTADTLAVARAGGPADNPTAGWADSVTGGAWTAAERVPTVVTDTASIHPAVQAYLDVNEIDRTVLFGGTAALSQAVEDGVPGAERIAGASRDSTAAAVAADLIGYSSDSDPRQLVMVNGYRADGWLFGLPAAGLAADAGTALGMVQDPLPPATADLACSPGDVDLLLAGGLGIITQAAADQVKSVPGC